jgi:quinoprotein glucose dehydrogenase
MLCTKVIECQRDFLADGYREKINLKTGVTIPSFGNDGHVTLRERLGLDTKLTGEIQSGAPDRVFDNLIVLGSAPGLSVRIASG